MQEKVDTITSLIAELQNTLGLKCESTLHSVAAEDWVAVIRDSYQPVQLAANLWIVPEDSVASVTKQPDTHYIILQPGLAFGTGDHPTTRLCLKWLNKAPLQGTNVLDYGTGSGILAIGALLFGATRAVGTDIDELAIRAAAQNAALNNIGADTFIGFRVPPDATPDVMARLQEQGPFQVCIANILRGPLLSLTGAFAAVTASGGLLALSGILETQAPAVMEAYGEDFESFEIETLDGWALVTGRRK